MTQCLRNTSKGLFDRAPKSAPAGALPNGGVAPAGAPFDIHWRGGATKRGSARLPGAPPGGLPSLPLRPRRLIPNEQRTANGGSKEVGHTASWRWEGGRARPAGGGSEEEGRVASR